MIQDSPPQGITRFIPGLALFRGLDAGVLHTELVVAVTVFAVLVPLAMANGDLAAKGVAVVGAVPSGLPALTIPDVAWRDIFTMLPAAFAPMVVICAHEILIPAFRFPRQVRPTEAWLALATMIGVLALGVLQGILIAVTLSLINVIYHISRPHDALLDDVEVGGGVVYREVADKQTVLTEPGLIVYRFDAPLVFANASYFSQRLNELVSATIEGLKCVILDAEAISDFDSTAAEALENLDADLERQGVELWIARPNEPLREMLYVTGLTKRLGKENIYPTVRAAVEAYTAQFASQ